MQVVRSLLPSGESGLQGDPADAVFYLEEGRAALRPRDRRGITGLAKRDARNDEVWRGETRGRKVPCVPLRLS